LAVLQATPTMVSIGHFIGRWLLALMLVAGCNHAAALTQAQALSIAQGETDARIDALAKATSEATDGLAPFVRALLDDENQGGGRPGVPHAGRQGH
jgi:hypothetical protein